MSDAIETFFGAWGDTDEVTRRAAIGASIADSGVYADPMTPEPLVGPDAVASYVAMFAQQAPGATVDVIDTQERHGVTRASVEFTMTDGQVQHGQYFVELDDSGTIGRMIGFVGLVTP